MQLQFGEVSLRVDGEGNWFGVLVEGSKRRQIAARDLDGVLAEVRRFAQRMAALAAKRASPRAEDTKGEVLGLPG